MGTVAPEYERTLVSMLAGAARALPMPVLDMCGSLFAVTEELGHGRADMVAVIEAISRPVGG